MALEPASPLSDRWQTALLLAAAAIALGSALQISNGNLHPQSIELLTLAYALCLAGVTAPRIRWLDGRGDVPAVALMGAGIAWQLGKLLTTPPGIYLQINGPMAYAPFFAALAVAAVLAGSFLSRSPWVGFLRVPLLLLTFLYLGAWLIKTSPDPFIDVHVFQRDGVAALLGGENPYAMTYPDIYGNSPFYGEGLSVNGRLTFGFPYPPLSLLLAIPGQVIAGDYRYSQLVAMAASGALMAYARPGRIGAVAAALFLFTPRVFFVLEQGWTEPYLVLLLSATVFFACRLPRALPFAFGLFLAVKQYLVFAVPLAFLVVPRPMPPWRELLRMGGKTAGIALAVSLPLVAWNMPAFIRDVVTLQIFQPFRAEALSYLAWFARDGSTPLPTSLAFAAALVGVGLALWRAPRTPAGFAASISLAYFGFFAFNKQAFCNYYYFVVGALCCAIAATRS